MSYRLLNRIPASREHEIMFGISLEGVGCVTTSPYAGGTYCHTPEMLYDYGSQYRTLEQYADTLDAGEIGRFAGEYFIVE